MIIIYYILLTKRKLKLILKLIMQTSLIKDFEVTLLKLKFNY